MSLLGKEKDFTLLLDPKQRKEVVLSRILKEAVLIDDYTIINFMLCRCWNKERVFLVTKQCGESLLHQAIERNFPETVRVLIQHGINVNSRNRNGNTSLHMAAMKGYEAILDLLIESGSNPFIENSVGKQAIDCVDSQHTSIKEKLRKYSVRSSRVKLMQNLETWKNIVEEEERKEDFFKKKIKESNRQRRKTSVITHQPSLQRTDSGIISDFDSDKSSSRQSINNSKLTNNVSLQTVNQLSSIPSEETSKLAKSKSFSVRDIASQYNSVTAALRKLSSHGKNDIKPSEIVTKENKNESNKKPGKGMKISSQYGVEPPKKSSKRRKKMIDRTKRMSLPLLPIFAPPESYI